MEDREDLLCQKKKNIQEKEKEEIEGSRIRILPHIILPCYSRSTMKQLLAVILHFLPLLVISSTPIHIDVTIDKTTYLVHVVKYVHVLDHLILNLLDKKNDVF